MKLSAEIIDAGDLTRAESEVLRQLCEAKQDKAIARALAISVKTVEAHLTHIYEKIGLQHQQFNQRCALIAVALERGMVSLSIKTLCVLLMCAAVCPSDDLIRAPRVRLARVQLVRVKRES